MNTNDSTNSKLDTQNNDEAIAEVSATEAETVAGGALTKSGANQPTTKSLQQPSRLPVEPADNVP